MTGNTILTAPSGRRVAVSLTSRGGQIVAESRWMEDGATSQDFAWANERIPQVAADIVGRRIIAVEVVSGDERACKAAASRHLYGGGNN